nr:MAG: polyprotein [Picornaviridae sp.]
MLGLAHLLYYMNEKMALKRIIDAVGNIAGLSDPREETTCMTPDRVTVGGSDGFTAVDQQSVTAAVVGNRFDEILKSAVDYPGSRRTQGQKFYLIDFGHWNHGNNYLDLVKRIPVASSLYELNHAVRGLLAYHRYARFGLEVIVQINPTPFQQGGLICAMIPGDYNNVSFASYPQFPHGMLNCNINNSCRVMVPWVHTRGMHDFHDPLYEPWNLEIRVWAQLELGAETSTDVSWSVLARFVDLEMHGLTPLSQMMRSEVRISSTNEVVNLCNIQDSKAKISLALGEEQFLRDDSCAGGTLVTNLRTWTETPTLMGHFPFNAGTAAGNRILTFPVNPYYFDINVRDQYPQPTSLAYIAQMYGMWRGDMVYHFQCFPTKFHSGRLLFCFIPGNEETVTNDVSMLKATNGFCATMDINGTASTLVFRVPWVCDNPYRINTYTRGNTVKGLYSSIGKVNVYVYTHLTGPSNVASHVWVNIYASAANLELVAPLYHAMKAHCEKGEYTPTLRSMAGDDSLPGAQVVEERPSSDGFATSGYADQMRKGEPVAAGVTTPPTGAATSIEDPLLVQKKPETFPEKDPGESRHTSDHMDIQTIMGRAHYWCQFTFTKDNQTYSVPISLNARGTTNGKVSMPSVLRWMYGMVHLYRGSMDLTVVMSGSTDVDGLLWYTPRGLATENRWAEHPPNTTQDWKAALGVVRFNTRRTGNLQVRIPWYTDCVALSAHVGSEITDNHLGDVTIQISNYSNTDEYLGVTLYLSFSNESCVYFPRAVMATDMIGSSGNKLAEVIADTVITEEEDAFNRYAQQDRPYKELRLDVGRWRLQYAKDELEKSKREMEERKKAHQILKKWKTHGDLQSQAGEKFEDGCMVEKYSGGYALRGFVRCNQVYYADSDSKALRLAPLINTGNFKVDDNLTGWVARGSAMKMKIDVMAAWLSSDMDFPFNFKAFVDGRVAFTEPVLTRLKAQLTHYYDELIDAMRPQKANMLDQVIGGSIIVGNVQGEIQGVTTECQSFFQQMRDATHRFSTSLSRPKALFVVKTIMSLCKAGLTLYVCHKMEWEIKRIAPLLGVLALDVAASTCDAVDLFTSAMADAVTAFGVRPDEIRSMSSNWLRDAVCGIAIFKAAKDAVMWVFEKIISWYDKHHGQKQKLHKTIVDAEGNIEGLLEEVDRVVATEVNDVNKAKLHSDCLAILQQTRTVMGALTTLNTGGRLLVLMRDASNKVAQKLRSLSNVNEPTVTRPEPVVIYLHGPRGGGKTLLSMCLATKICKELKVDPKENIYTKPIGSDYWDGYANQLVCIIDDIGQRTDDSDWQDFCQLVSGCPLRLNMAAIEEKGRHFTSPYIICTSNLETPMPKTVYIAEAIHRRLHIKVGVKPHQDYEKNARQLDLNVGVLDVEKAKKDGKIKDMSCVQCTVGKSSICVDLIVATAVSMGTKRKQNMDEFVDLWSQQSTSSNDMDTVFGPVKYNGKLHDIFEKMREHPYAVAGVVLGVLGLIGSIFGIVKVVKHFSKEEKKNESAGAYSSQPRPNKVVHLCTDVVKSMSVIEISHVVQKNIVRFGMGDNEDSVKWLLNGLGVKDDWILVPSHSYKFDKEYEYFFIEKANTYYCLQREKVEVVELDVGFQDLVLMRFPGIPKFRDITAHFVKREDLVQCAGKIGTLCTVNGGIYQMINEGKLKHEETISYNHKTLDGREVALNIGSVWRGTGEALPGSCGGVVVSSNNKLQNPICGVHVAGGRSSLIAKCVWQEMFDVIDRKRLESQRITQVRFVDKQLHMGSKTKFKKSPVYDAVVAEKEVNVPAALPYSPKHDVDPLQVMLSKYDRPVVEEPEGYMKSVCYVTSKLGEVCTDVEGFLTEDEAINGIEGMDAINLDTSPGIPYVFHNLNKRKLLKPHVHPMLRLKLDQTKDAIDNGLDIDCVFSTCAKDELRKIEKVVESETRAIECAPLHFTIAVRQYWGKVIAALQTNPGWHTGIAVGMDADSDWDPMFKSALRFADIGVDLDFRNFDASLSPFMIMKGCKVMGMLSGLDDDRNDMIARAICYSTHMVGNMVYLMACPH